MKKPTDSSPRKRLTLRIPRYLDKILKRVALEKETTVTSLVTRAIFMLLWKEHEYEEKFSSLEDFFERKTDILKTLDSIDKKKAAFFVNAEQGVLKEIEEQITKNNPWFSFTEDDIF